LSLIKGHGVHLGFNQGHPAAFHLASFVCCVFLWVKVDEVGFRSYSSLLSGAVSGIVSFFATGEAVKCAPLSSVSHISSPSPLSPCISFSSRPPIVLWSGSFYIHGYGGIAHRWQGIWRVVLSLLVTRGRSAIVVWSLVSERDKGEVSSRRSFCG
jgi:hypothetical protein